jgi:osmotically-inducible protein OsmY
MGKARLGRGERALSDLIGVIDQVRGTLVRRLDDIDLEAMRKRGNRFAGSVRTDVERRVRPRRRRISPWGVVGISGLVVLGAAAVGVGYVVYDRERRDAARRRLDGMQSRAKERYAELTGGRTSGEAALENRVNQAIAEGGPMPGGLEVVVEGNTVYLRGIVPDPAYVDAAVERVHTVPGVVAVVNLTTGAREGASRSS